MLSGSSSPLSVTSDPFVTVVEPPTPECDALHVLEKRSAVNTSLPVRLTRSTVTVLVTDTVGPVDASVLTVIGPNEDMVAGPMITDP